MKFPNLVYRCPGVHQCPGGTFSTKPVKNEAEAEAAFSDGWSSTLPIACGDEIKEEIETASPEDKVDNDSDDEPPTREEIETACKELDIPFRKNTPDKKLMALIDEKLG